MSSTRSAISRATWASTNSRASISWAKRARRSRSSLRSNRSRSSLMGGSRSAALSLGRSRLYHGVHADRRGRAQPGGAARFSRDETGKRRLAAAGARPPCRSPLAAGLHLLPPRIGSHGLLCGACFASIDFIAPPLCARLGVPLPYEAGEPPLSAAAIASPPVYDRARAAARYSDTMRELIQSFKYRDRHEGLPLFARWLSQGRGRASRRRRPHRAGAALPLAAVVAAVQPVGHARSGGGPAHRHSGRLRRC